MGKHSTEPVGVVCLPITGATLLETNHDRGKTRDGDRNLGERE
jgi:hypothetical protein